MKTIRKSLEINQEYCDICAKLGDEFLIHTKKQKVNEEARKSLQNEYDALERAYAERVSFYMYKEKELTAEMVEALKQEKLDKEFAEATRMAVEEAIKATAENLGKDS